MTELRATIAYVPLSLEETGTIFHVLMSQFHSTGLDPSLPIEPQLPQRPDGLTTRATDVVVLERIRALLWKMGGANDRLMGKV